MRVDTVDADGVDETWTETRGRLVRVVTKRDFGAAMAFVNRVALVAETIGHHPDIEISWNRVTLRLWTHDAGKVTDLDHDLARRIDEVV